MKLFFYTLLIAGILVTECFGRSIKCDCDCTKKPNNAVCAKDPKSGDTDTFLNTCHMQCFNCTHSKNYYVIKEGDCKMKGKK